MTPSSTPQLHVAQLHVAQLHDAQLHVTQLHVAQLHVTLHNIIVSHFITLHCITSRSFMLHSFMLQLHVTLQSAACKALVISCKALGSMLQYPLNCLEVVYICAYLHACDVQMS